VSAPRHLWSGDWERDSAAAAERLARARGSGAAGSEAAPGAVGDDGAIAEAGQSPEPTSSPVEVRRQRERVRLGEHHVPPPLVHAGPAPEPRLPLGERLAAALKAAWVAFVRSLETARRSVREWWQSAREARGRKWLRTVLPVFLAALVSAVAAYALVSAVIGSGGNEASASAGTPWLGVNMTSSSPLVGLLPPGVGSTPLSGGVIVTNVVAGSPAAAAGLEPGDVITAVNNTPVASPGDVTNLINARRVGDEIELQYQRGLAVYTAVATLTARPAGYP
jgi:hypothetical protein